MNKTIICGVAATMLTLPAWRSRRSRSALPCRRRDPRRRSAFGEEYGRDVPQNHRRKGVEYLVLDDASDTTLAVQNARS